MITHTRRNRTFPGSLPYRLVLWRRGMADMGTRQVQHFPDKPLFADNFSGKARDWENTSSIIL